MSWREPLTWRAVARLCPPSMSLQNRDAPPPMKVPNRSEPNTRYGWLPESRENAAAEGRGLAVSIGGRERAPRQDTGVVHPIHLVVTLLVRGENQAVGPGGDGERRAQGRDTRDSGVEVGDLGARLGGEGDAVHVGAAGRA